MYKILAFVSLFLSLFCFFIVQILKNLQMDLILLSNLATEDFSAVSFSGEFLIIPIIFLMIAIVLFFIAFKDDLKRWFKLYQSKKDQT